MIRFEKKQNTEGDEDHLKDMINTEPQDWLDEDPSSLTRLAAHIDKKESKEVKKLNRYKIQDKETFFFLQQFCIH